MHRLVYPQYQHRTPGAGGWRVVDGWEGDAMSLPIKGQSWGSPDEAAAVAIQRGAKRPAFLREYAGHLWRDCEALGIRADVAFAQADLETGHRQTGIGFQSDRWLNEGNPAGLGVVDNLPDGTPVHTFTPETAARIHATHLAGYAGIAPPVDWVDLDFRWGDMLRAGYYGVASTTDDLSGRWATGSEYGPKIEARWRRYGFTAPDAMTPPAGDGTGGTRPGGTAMKAHQVPGLSRPVYMPADMRVSIDLVPARVRNVRSNSKRAAATVTRYTDHETANYIAGANARMHRNWLHAGAGGSYVGFNSVNDDRELIVLTPYDEVTWAAGTPAGNATSDHSERCVNAGINHTRARGISAAWAAGVIHARGLTVQGALVQHNIWFGKNCPAILRRDGLWPSYVNMVAAAYGRIVAHLNGDAGPVEIGKGDAVATTARLNVREGFGTGYPVIVTLDAGTAATIVDGPQTSDGYTWWQVEAGDTIGWVAQDWLQVTEKAAEPEDGWPYPAPIVPAWWEDITTGKRPYIEDAGMRWYRANVLYRATKATKRQQLAVGDDRVVGPDLTPGATFRGAAVGQSALDKKSYTITPGLTRVDLDALEVVEEADEAAPDAA